MKHKRPVYWFPSQLALVLGVSQRDLLEEVNLGHLPATRNGKIIKIRDDDLILFLHDHPEFETRIDHEDLPTEIVSMRKAIKHKLEVMF